MIEHHEYRATARCLEDQTLLVLDHPNGPFETKQGALLHAETVCRNVLSHSTSTWRAGIQHRTTTPWEDQ